MTMHQLLAKKFHDRSVDRLKSSSFLSQSYLLQLYVKYLHYSKLLHSYFFLKVFLASRNYRNSRHGFVYQGLGIKWP